MNQSGHSSPTVRRRRSGAEVAALLSAFAQSGQSAGAFCREHEMPVASFSSLLRRHAGRHSSLKRLPATAGAGLNAASLLPVEILEERASISVRKCSSLTVEVPGGFRIIVEQDFDTNTLRRLVSALGSV